VLSFGYFSKQVEKYQSLKQKFGKFLNRISAVKNLGNNENKPYYLIKNPLLCFKLLFLRQKYPLNDVFNGYLEKFLIF